MKEISVTVGVKKLETDSSESPSIHESNNATEPNGGNDMAPDAKPEVVDAASKPDTEISANWISDLECPVCNEIFLKAVTLNCSHSFCTECLHNCWAEASGDGKGKCPVCKTKTESMNPTRSLDRIVEKVVNSWSSEKTFERGKIEEQHGIWKKRRTEREERNPLPQPPLPQVLNPSISSNPPPAAPADPSMFFGGPGLYTVRLADGDPYTENFQEIIYVGPMIQ